MFMQLTCRSTAMIYGGLIEVEHSVEDGNLADLWPVKLTDLLEVGVRLVAGVRL